MCYLHMVMVTHTYTYGYDVSSNNVLMYQVNQSNLTAITS